ncbi:hypothetical protein RPMA_21890 [Tardiphaga alba]|uniref:Cysteine-rich CWC family protein n=1 Tax=Tardiphaga alba TaxID=340268 RepID=A0ABX8ABQ9_9BRAD|nr:hypothetical protein [Tardiphaga alba]QUS41198.1 hypothetical protein RPMA_21890 [Tardiphaga alba]
MTNRTGTQTEDSAAALSRRLTCSACGAEFGCDLSGNCWCAEEPAKLPMPTTGGDCLCRDCLREAAAAHERSKRA